MPDVAFERVKNEKPEKISFVEGHEKIFLPWKCLIIFKNCILKKRIKSFCKIRGKFVLQKNEFCQKMSVIMKGCILMNRIKSFCKGVDQINSLLIKTKHWNFVSKHDFFSFRATKRLYISIISKWARISSESDWCFFWDHLHYYGPFPCSRSR